MSTKHGMLLLTLVATLGTGCCYDQCGYYSQCCGAYDPCTGLVQNQCDPFAKCRAKRIRKKLGKHRRHGGKHDCDCYGDTYYDDGCSCDDGMTYYSGCWGESYGTPIETYGEPIYGEPMESYYQGGSYPELMVPQDAKPIKPVPPPEPAQLPAPEEPSIPPASYVVPAPLEGPDVPVLQPYHGS